jgi:hypothetical protein
LLSALISANGDELGVELEREFSVEDKAERKDQASSGLRGKGTRSQSVSEVVCLDSGLGRKPTELLQRGKEEGHFRLDGKS